MKLVANIRLTPSVEEAGVALLTCRKGEVDLARAATLPVLFVDPKGCPACGVIDDKNRPNQAIFSCRRVATLATRM